MVTFWFRIGRWFGSDSHVFIPEAVVGLAVTVSRYCVVENQFNLPSLHLLCHVRLVNNIYSGLNVTTIQGFKLSNFQFPFL